MKIRIKHSQTEMGLVFDSRLWVLIFRLFPHLCHHLHFLLFWPSLRMHLCTLYISLEFLPCRFSSDCLSLGCLLILWDPTQNTCYCGSNDIGVMAGYLYSENVGIYLYFYFMWYSRL